MKKFAIVLSGCGVFDGSEIHETTLTMLAISKHGAEYDLFAPDKDQHHVINHITGEVVSERRNVLVESARIARGKIKPLDKMIPEYYDSLILPGGFGVAKNLSSWAFEASHCDIDHDLENIIKQFYYAKKPIGALCIAPTIIAKVVGNVKVTVGTDPDTAADIEKTGSTHIESGNEDVIIDKENNIFSTPCYMLNSSISQIAISTEKIIKAILEVLK